MRANRIKTMCVSRATYIIAARNLAERIKLVTPNFECLSTVASSAYK